ncbi:4-hydroxy-tetrahydrodipicolinate reductase [Endozoicomonas sp. Mp262]|uniref:4-hydroxy-tetrahydrodipicolinate reductase n=1 Tax=Endozoicomonas sp. Mp262 TaxID=2919499 RepID=UPI0021DAC360
MINVAVVGVAGRMGRMLVEALACDKYTSLVAAIAPPESALLGVDAGELVGAGTMGVAITDSLEKCIDKVDAVIDFTVPDYTLENAALCAKYKKKLVIGTTGLTEAQIEGVQKAAQETGIVFAPNMSIGVNLVFKLLEMAAKTLEGDADVEIIEAHHKNKVDAPSGTALKMGRVVAEATGKKLEDCAVYAREGYTGPRKQGTIGFATVRAGDVIGDHTSLFACAGERIEVTHKASDRIIYARGAIRAVRFLQDKQSGLFDMQDVLGLS